MTDSIRLGRVFGIPIGMNWSIVAIAVLFTASLAMQALPLYAPDASLQARTAAAAVAVVVFFISILAHELGHALVALGHGIGVSGITLWLLGGVAKLDRQAETAKAEAQIAIAGPAVSLGLGMFFGAVTIIVSAIISSPLTTAVLAWLAGVNLVLAVFNMLPAAPLDGGRVLTAVLWKRLGNAERARVIAGRCGLLLGLALVIAGVVQVLVLEQLGGWITALVGLFTFMAARNEIAMAVVRGRLLTTQAAALLLAHPESIPDTVTVHQLVDWTRSSAGQAAYPVVRWGTEPIGYVVPSRALATLSDAERSWTRVNQVMCHADEVDRFFATDSIDDIFRQWGDRPGRVATVHDPQHGRMLGTITDEQLRPMLAQPDLWGRTDAVGGSTTLIADRPMG